MNQPRSASSGTEPRHPIRVVATRTGLTPTVLRAWERRYGVVEPQRSDGGQRLYSDAQIDRLLLLKSVTDAGRAISQVADLDDGELRALADEDRAASRRVAEPVVPKGSPDRLRASLDVALQAVDEMDAAALEAELRRGVVSFGAESFMDGLVAPLLRAIGERWSRGELRPAQEHVATAVVERVLSWMLEPARPAPGAGPVLVVGTLAGEEHALGALLAAAAAALEGWRVTFLGRDLPAQEIAMAAERLGARAVGVSVVNPLAADGVPDQLRDLLERLPAGVAVILGGATAEALTREVPDGRLTAVPDLVRFRAALGALAN